MAKRLLEDIVKNKNTQKTAKIVLPSKLAENKDTKSVSTKSSPKYVLWFVALISVIFCFFAFSYLFSKAEIVVNPKIKEVALNENFSATKDASGDSLGFNTVIISGEESETVQATEEKEVKEVATGSVVIYNSFSSVPQNLNIDTRLEGSNGKIYKTLTKATVPGMTKGKVPGSVEVKIYAAQPGEEYNSDPLDFKIYGFRTFSPKILGTGHVALFGGTNKVVIGNIPFIR
jgi:hypothetical protein